jgi:hypothetical protein
MEGDINKDGNPDYTFWGKCNGKFLGKWLFAAIVSLKDDRIKKEFFDVISIPHDGMFFGWNQDIE